LIEFRNLRPGDRTLVDFTEIQAAGGLAFIDHAIRFKLAAGIRQQVATLHVANIVKTKFFITFDADVILCEPIRPQDMMPTQQTFQPRRSHQSMAPPARA
jgi:hypothetical protein